MRKHLINYRKGLDLTINEMSEKIGISSSYYEKIEAGHRNPSFNFMWAFKKEFPDANTDSIFFND